MTKLTGQNEPANDMCHTHTHILTAVGSSLGLVCP